MRQLCPVTLLALPLLAFFGPTPEAAAQELGTTLLGTVPGRPTGIVFAPGVTDQAYVATKNGRIWRFANGNYVSPPFLDLSAEVNSSGEGGLIGFVFDPEFATNGYFYVAYTEESPFGNSVVSRFSVQPGSVDLADPSSETILWGPLPQISLGHKGGDLEFGPDGLLYHSIGDGDGGSAMGLNRSQDLSDPRGKVLRFDVRAPYPHVPTNNPFVGTAGADPHVWAYGFRNPFRLEVDAFTGDVFVGDVGGGLWEEITRVLATNAGANAGWPCIEGNQCRTFVGCTCPNPAFLPPITVLSHSAPDMACSIMGGVVVRGGSAPNLEGTYLFSDFCSGRFYQISDPSGAALVTEISGMINNGDPIRYVTDYTVGPDGNVYFVSHYGGEVWMLEPLGSFGNYCSTAPNSSGLPASLAVSGSTSIGDGNLILEVTDLPQRAFGLFLMSQSQTSVPQFGGSQGTLCVAPPFYRWFLPGGDSGPFGRIERTSDLTDLPPMVSIIPGDTWYFQYWTRDANPMPTSNTSDGAIVQFVP